MTISDKMEFKVTWSKVAAKLADLKRELPKTQIPRAVAPFRDPLRPLKGGSTAEGNKKADPNTRSGYPHQRGN